MSSQMPAALCRLFTVSVESVRPMATYVPAMGAGQPSIEASIPPAVLGVGMSAAGAWSNGSEGSVQSEIAQPFMMPALVPSPAMTAGCSGDGSSFGSVLCAQKRQVRTDSGAVSHVAFLLPGYSIQKPVRAVWTKSGLLQPLPPV